MSIAQACVSRMFSSLRRFSRLLQGPRLARVARRALEHVRGVALIERAVEAKRPTRDRDALVAGVKPAAAQSVSPHLTPAAARLTSATRCSR
jgi:hypothetical protein